LMLLGAIAGAELAMRDVGIEVELGSGVGAAQAHFRGAQAAKETKVAAE
jgi:alanine-glyoxylate transaminase / serine-glyoxylate transaminase / serine-pyruvate transaminase